MPPLAPVNGKAPRVSAISPFDPEGFPNRGFSPNERMPDLQRDISNVKRFKARVDSEAELNAEQIRKAKIELLSKFYEVLQTLGVDPTDLNSINAFLQKLGEQDPDLLELFNVAFAGLDPDAGMPATPPGAGPAEGEDVTERFRDVRNRVTDARNVITDEESLPEGPEELPEGV